MNLTELESLLTGSAAAETEGTGAEAGSAAADSHGFTEADHMLFQAADRVRRKVYGDGVYLRGLIEITNYCRNDCYYCGIRKGNSGLARYRLDRETILDCCREGYALGFRTFVLQGGEDPWFTDERLSAIVERIHREFPDCAITLSMGERSRESYRMLRDAGARRYLLRHEAADEQLYVRLHPEQMSLENRMECLWNLKELGYQVGAGLMVGAPYQRPEHLLADIRFLQKLEPDMIGIGPYLHQKDTPFRDFPDGSMQMTVRLLAVLRLLFPHALLPSTTALGSIDPAGRELGLKAGGNVVMPNLSPRELRSRYAIYDHKAAAGAESAQGLERLIALARRAGYRVDMGVGDVKRPGRRDEDGTGGKR